MAQEQLRLHGIDALVRALSHILLACSSPRRRAYIGWHIEGGSTDFNSIHLDLASTSLGAIDLE
jgi:hypothetical protein